MNKRERWELKQTRLILEDINRWFNEESEKQNYLEEKRHGIILYEYDEELDYLDYDDSEYEDNLEGRDI